MRGVTMDDLDHSMHIAEDDWMSFYEESEACCLQQPSLACTDNLSLSDSEEETNSSSIFSIDQTEVQQSPATNDNVSGCCTEHVQMNHSESEGEPDDFMAKAEENKNGQVKSDVCIDGLNTIYATDDIITTRQTVRLNVPSRGSQWTELIKHSEDTQRKSNLSFTHEHGHNSGIQTDLKASEPHTSVCNSILPTAKKQQITAEKERWFVTLEDSTARQRIRNMSVNNKQRPKKPCNNNHTCQTPGQEKLCEDSPQLEVNNKPEGGKETQSNQNSACSAEAHPQNFQIETISDSSLMCLSPEDESSSDQQITCHITEPTTNSHKHDLRSLASTSQDTFPAFNVTDSTRLVSVESDECADSVEFLSIHSCDSESYMSAFESLEDTQHLLVEYPQLQSSSSVAKITFPFSPTENTNADDTQDKQSFSSQNCLSCNLITANYETSSPITSLKDEHCLPFVSDVNVTLDSASDSPEKYAAATGQTQPVYAISAFWDEMEKITINDILQLKMCRGTRSSDTQETVMPRAEDFSANHSPVVDTVWYNFPNAAPLDTSESAESDYCTQLDESKPDCSSCEFSTSDFDEEYCPFLGAGENPCHPCPDPKRKNQNRTTDSPLFVHEEEESVTSEGMETHFPSKECFEYQDSDALILSTLACPRQIRKCESVWNVPALNTRDPSLLVNSENSLFLNTFRSLEENAPLKRTDSLETLISAHFLSDKTKCVTVYDPDSLTVAPVFDYTPCSFCDETSFTFLHDPQRKKPIPIFSCSHPTIRELTLCNQDNVLTADCEEKEDVSAIKVGSGCFIHGSDYGAFAETLQGLSTLKGLLSRRKICYQDKDSVWCRRSSAWVFPVKAGITRVDPSNSVCTSPSQLSQEVAVQHSVLEAIQTARQDNIFSTLKQSDMCLVCIAFASWVLRSSDPDATDAWKAVLLANVSALSAIQYLRKYVKKTPFQEESFSR
ncbi:serine-rich adhesin for platelets [Antennarius striatus]|uniref:serine-rich adhesin for platelets n=1 Tax=Antennarius striatus TaxID=241820 RepID=UPI0035B4C8ED